jgi:hypothetical protein
MAEKPNLEGIPSPERDQSELPHTPESAQHEQNFNVRNSEVEEKQAAEALGQAAPFTANETIPDLSNYNADGLQGPLINESEAQIKERLTEWLNGGKFITENGESTSAEKVDIMDEINKYSQIS